MARDSSYFGGGKALFSPSVLRELTSNRSTVANQTAALHSGSIQSKTGSFRYDPPDAGVKSTQQLPVDWSKFENHTFFNSAEAKVNTAFDQIINSFPFDGQRPDVLVFYDNLTGFEKYVYDSFPKHRGFLHFSGTQTDENPEGGFAAELGTHIRVSDSAGSYYPSLARNRSGEPVVDPGTKTVSFDFHFRVPDLGVDTGNQVIAQKLTGSDGFTLFLSSSTSTVPSSSVVFLASSGSRYMSASMQLEKGKFHHVCATLNRTPNIHRMQLYRDFALITTSSRVEMGDFGITTSPLLIGSGTKHDAGLWESEGDVALEFQQTLSGSLDEFRVFHEPRSVGMQKKEGNKTIYPRKDLRLYFKFNEPTGSYSSNDLVLDSSGNALHSTVVNYITDLRILRGLSIPVARESDEDCPVLFPTYPDLITLNQRLLSSASVYDSNNPNMITKLIPKHYLLEASHFEGFEKETGEWGEDYGSSKDMPGGGKLGSPQIISAFLFVWAKFFDEIKMHLDQFGKLTFVDQVPEGSIADQFLLSLGSAHGFVLPDMASDASLSQFSDGVDMTVDSIISNRPLQYVQNQIWRRILADMGEIVRSKGTIHSIKTLMRDMGINPDKSFRFREFGGAKTRRISDVRDITSEVSTMLDFSGTFANVSQNLTAQGNDLNKPFITSPHLSASRIEPGIPNVVGTMVQHLTNYQTLDKSVERNYDYSPHGISNSPNDGLLTSGSWTYEAIYQFPGRRGSMGRSGYPLTQSLARFCVTGTTTAGDASGTGGLIMNLLAFSGSLEDQQTGSLSLIAKPTISGVIPMVLPLTGVDIFDGDKWHITMGRARNDLTGSITSSSYYLHAGKINEGRLTAYESNAKYFNDHGESTTYNLLENVSTTHNISGSFFVIGSQSISMSVNSNLLNRTTYDSMFRHTFFAGRVGHIRFWSKEMTDRETQEHIYNFKSLGSDDPHINFNFKTSRSGSFGRLRIDASTDQSVTKSNADGELSIFDFSQGNFHLTGSGFEPLKQMIHPEKFRYSMLSPNFDQARTGNKVRVRSHKHKSNVKKFGTSFAPIYAIPPNENPVDDTRFSIEVSGIQALNEDMVSLFSTLDLLDNILGAPELVFSPDYPDLVDLRDIYFNRLTDKVNYKKFFEFFKWFDSSMGMMIERLVPRKTKFLGVNFVVESHMFERAKYHHAYHDMYLGPNDRHGLKGQILMQQFIAHLRRF
jgi:hypothetical protein